MRSPPAQLKMNVVVRCRAIYQHPVATQGREAGLKIPERACPRRSGLNPGWTVELKVSLSAFVSAAAETAAVRSENRAASEMRPQAGLSLLPEGTFPIAGASKDGMRKNLKWILAVLVAGFALLQLANPSRTNPPVVAGHDLLATNPPPPEVATLLRHACYDCHSNETRWPWYSHIAPVSWLVAGDVAHGRERLNFSDWPRELPGRAAKRLERISEELGYKDMPPGKYTLMHPEARLTAGQRQRLIDWADAEAARLKAATTNQ
jgi:hypothetical protein